MATVNMLQHAKEILVRAVPQALQYRIPLYLPQERIIFNASELIFTLKHDKDLSYFDLNYLQLKDNWKPLKPIEILVEDLKNPKVQMK